MEVASVTYRLCTYEKNYHTAIYDTDFFFYRYGSDKIGYKTIVTRTKQYMQCP